MPGEAFNRRDGQGVGVRRGVIAHAGLWHETANQTIIGHLASWEAKLFFAPEHSLVLPLRFSLTAVVSGGGFGLVSSSPVRPGHDKAGSDWGPEQKSGQKIADLGHCRQKRREAHQAAAGTAGLLSFALAHVARRRSAANRARKAAAAKHKLMCRCHPG